MKGQESLDWEWMDWHKWATELLDAHDHSAVANSIADLGLLATTLRRGMAAEARIVDAQVLSLSPRALGKGRRKIVAQQVRRMYRCALAKEMPRPLVRYGGRYGYLERVRAELGELEDRLAAILEGR